MPVGVVMGQPSEPESGPQIRTGVWGLAVFRPRELDTQSGESYSYVCTVVGYFCTWDDGWRLNQKPVCFGFFFVSLVHVIVNCLAVLAWFGKARCGSRAPESSFLGGVA